MVTGKLNIAEQNNGFLKQEEGYSPLAKNAQSIGKELHWFASVVNARLDEHFAEQGNKGDSALDSNHVQDNLGRTLAPPDLSKDSSVYSEFVNYYSLSSDERLLLMLALAPHVQPHLLDVFLSVNKHNGRGYTEFGGVKGGRHGGFLPTIETALFLIAGNDLVKRFTASQYFEPDHIFYAHGILVSAADNTIVEPRNSNVITLSDEYVDFFTSGKLGKPSFSTAFPAKLLITGMSWDDLVVDAYTGRQLNEIMIWLQYGDFLRNSWEMASRIKPGFKALFYGPSGTGKTLTAALLGKRFGLDVYRIDLSMVISKYIGETEKNLEKVFSKAEHKNWILFFDEADALFGKRTGIADAHDKYANQEIAYLLQRLEDFPGLVILASNMRNNVDEAFTRRLQSVIHFKKPLASERYLLWRNSFSKHCEPPTDQELEKLAQQYEITGGGITNAVQYASLMALSRSERKIAFEDVVSGIKKEFSKEGKTL